MFALGGSYAKSLLRVGGPLSLQAFATYGRDLAKKRIEPAVAARVRRKRSRRPQFIYRDPPTSSDVEDPSHHIRRVRTHARRQEFRQEAHDALWVGTVLFHSRPRIAYPSVAVSLLLLNSDHRPSWIASIDC